MSGGSFTSYLCFCRLAINSCASTAFGFSIPRVSAKDTSGTVIEITEQVETGMEERCSGPA